MRTINSIKDPAFESLRASRTIAGRHKEKTYLIEKQEMIEEALRAGVRLKALYTTQSLPPHLHIPCEIYQISQGMMTKIFSSETPAMVALAYQREASLDEMKGARLLLVLDQVQNCQNIGMIFRSAEAFGVQGIMVIPHPTADLYDRNVIKASMGSFFRIPVAQCTSSEAIAHLRKEKVAILSTSLEAQQTLESLQASFPCALVVGNETHGISAEMAQAADQLIAIPMKGEIQSLNVVVATSICLYRLSC
jgi:TrmH family RNA methyltransferase